MQHTILFADDDLLMHRLYVPYLERAGHQVLSATTGRQALSLAVTHLPDLILLDIDMPELSGFAALDQLRHFAPTASTPVILMSADPKHLASSSKPGKSAAAFLLKPFSPSLIISLTHRLTPSAAA